MQDSLLETGMQDSLLETGMQDSLLEIKECKDMCI